MRTAVDVAILIRKIITQMDFKTNNVRVRLSDPQMRRICDARFIVPTSFIQMVNECLADDDLFILVCEGMVNYIVVRITSGINGLARPSTAVLDMFLGVNLDEEDD